MVNFVPLQSSNMQVKETLSIVSWVVLPHVSPPSAYKPCVVSSSCNVHRIGTNLAKRQVQQSGLCWMVVGQEHLKWDVQQLTASVQKLQEKLQQDRPLDDLKGTRQPALPYTPDQAPQTVSPFVALSTYACMHNIVKLLGSYQLWLRCKSA